MSTQPTIRSIVDDTALITNTEEIGQWVQKGLVALVVPLHTLERLNVLKKDHSQIGVNARKAVKFLDQITSSAQLQRDQVSIQGPDDQFPDWSHVEARYAISYQQQTQAEVPEKVATKAVAGTTSVPGTSPDRQFAELSLKSDDSRPSPLSTPPLSPATSEPQSTRTSPELSHVVVSKHEATPVPPILQPLVNFVVWYTYARTPDVSEQEVVFLTNSADSAQIAKEFGVDTKTIHQLRARLFPDADNPVESLDHLGKRHQKSSDDLAKSNIEPRTLFRYDENSSEEDEELLFKPRVQNSPHPRPGSSNRGRANIALRNGRGPAHSPSNSLNSSNVQRPQIPVEEIDPDSFDRGSFGRGSTPLANVGNHGGFVQYNFSRNGSPKATFSINTSRGNTQRGNNNPRGGRGRGRLFVP